MPLTVLAPATGGKNGYDKAEDWRWVLELVQPLACGVFNIYSFIKNKGARVLKTPMSCICRNEEAAFAHLKVGIDFLF